MWENTDMKALSAAAIAASFLIATGAQATPTITVTPTVAPNAYGSSYWGQWVANSIYAQENGLTTYGDSGLPSYYHAQDSGSIANAIVTSNPSWLGQADPGTAFGAAFANEYGNRIHFGLVIDGNGSQFSISELGFTAVSDDSTDALGFSYGAGSYDYSTDYVGVLAGQDGILWTADDIYITSGPSTQLVDGLVGRGSGNAFWPDENCAGCSSPAELQTTIDAFETSDDLPSTFTGTYTLGDFSGAGIFHFSGAVPEPASWALLIAGFALTGVTLRRGKRAKVQFA